MRSLQLIIYTTGDAHEIKAYLIITNKNIQKTYKILDHTKKLVLQSLNESSALAERCKIINQ